MKDATRQPSLALGAAWAFMAAVTGAFLWGAMVGTTGLTLELDWVPLIGIGFVVGTTVRVAGRGFARSFFDCLLDY